MALPVSWGNVAIATHRTRTEFRGRPPCPSACSNLHASTPMRATPCHTTATGPAVRALAHDCFTRCMVVELAIGSATEEPPRTSWPRDPICPFGAARGPLSASWLAAPLRSMRTSAHRVRRTRGVCWWVEAVTNEQPHATLLVVPGRRLVCLSGVLAHRVERASSRESHSVHGSFTSMTCERRDTPTS